MIELEITRANCSRAVESPPRLIYSAFESGLVNSLPKPCTRSAAAEREAIEMAFGRR
jgi:hypothetical protein